jgi:hypothetical protein
MQDANNPSTSTTKPCWWSNADATACPTTQTHFQLNVVRTAPPATGTTVDVQCAVQPM